MIINALPQATVEAALDNATVEYFFSKSKRTGLAVYVLPCGLELIADTSCIDTRVWQEEIAKQKLRAKALEKLRAYLTFEYARQQYQQTS
jgi:hypothetical protein